MIGNFLLTLSVVAAAGIYTIFSAPLSAEEGMIAEDNATHTCLRDALPEKLKTHYDMCAEKNEEEMVKEDEILLCILKAEGVVMVSDESEEIALDASKLKMAGAEVETPDTEQDTFDMSLDQCTMDETVKVSEVVQCLLDKLQMNCTSSLLEKEDGMIMMMPMEEAEPEN